MDDQLDRAAARPHRPRDQPRLRPDRAQGDQPAGDRLRRRQHLGREPLQRLGHAGEHGTNKAAKKAIKVGFGPYAIAYGAGSIWVSNESSGSVSRINPARNRVTKTIKTGGGPNGLVVAFGSLWVADYRLGRVLRIDPAKNKITAKLQLAHADWITPTADALWISSETNSVYRLDPQTLQITASVPVGHNPLASTLFGDELWVPNIDSNTVSVVDTATAAVTATIPVGPAPIAVVQEAGDLWVTSEGDGDVWRLPPTAGRR